MNNNTQFMSWLYYSINIDKRLLCKSQSRSLKPIEFNFVFKSHDNESAEPVTFTFLFL